MSPNPPPTMDQGKFPSSSFPDCHWRLCCQFMDRYRNLLPAEQLDALGHIFANTQLVLCGNVGQTMALVLDLVGDQLPPAEVGQVENRCWERDAEPEFPDLSTDDAEVTVEQEPEEVEDSDCFEVECSRNKIIDLSSDVEDEDQPSEAVDQVPEEVVEDSDCFEVECSRNKIIEINSDSDEETDSINLTATAPEPRPNPIQPPAFNYIPTRSVPYRRPTITLEIIGQNLVLFDDDFWKTQAYYNRRFGRDRLMLTITPGTATHVKINVDQLILCQVSARDRSMAIQMACEQFFRIMKSYCYTVETLDPANAFNRITTIVQRFPVMSIMSFLQRPLIDIDPALYEQVMCSFARVDNGCHLVFSADFTDLECGVMLRIATNHNIPGRLYEVPGGGGRKRFLVLARELPPQDIVRRIVTEWDAALGFQYRVTAPPQHNRC